MAENKKSFVLYADQIHLFESLDDFEAGLLIKHIFKYVTDQNPETDNRIVKIAFEPIKHQLKRDLLKWENTREGRSKAGKASAEKRKQTPTNSTFVESVEQTPTNSTVTVNVNDNVTKSNIVSSSIEERTLTFKKSLNVFSVGAGGKYSNEILKAFVQYWAEPNKSKTKMRWELQKTWDLNLRLQRWSANDFNKKETLTSNQFNL